MKVLVVGARGRLGSAVVREFRAHGDVVAPARADLDITDEVRVRARVAAESPDPKAMAHDGQARPSGPILVQGKDTPHNRSAIEHRKEIR